MTIGERLEDESFREITIREVAWSLWLNRKRDFFVSNMAQMNLDFVVRVLGHFPKSRDAVSFFEIKFYRKDVVLKIERQGGNFWVTSDEICNGISQCGQQFDPIVPYLINRSSVIQYWESSQCPGAQGSRWFFRGSPPSHLSRRGLGKVKRTQFSNRLSLIHI